MREFSSDQNINSNTNLVVEAVVDAILSQAPKMRYHIGSFPLNCVGWLPTWLGDMLLQVLVKEPFVSRDDNNNCN